MIVEGIRGNKTYQIAGEGQDVSKDKAEAHDKRQLILSLREASSDRNDSGLPDGVDTKGEGG